MIHHILFPVDFSTQCVAAKATVQAWAARLGARITLLHVFQPVPYYSPDTDDIGAAIHILYGLAKQRLDEFSAEGWEGVALNPVLVEGSAASAIVAYAHDHAVDLIFMPTQGHSRFRQLMLGSVTSSVLHDSEVPVWTSAHIPDPAHSAKPQTILCAVDCGSETAKVVAWAMAISRDFAAGLKVIHVNPSTPTTFESGIAEGAHQFGLRRAKEDYELAMAGIADAPQLEIVENSSLVDAVRLRIESEKADLLVIGRGKTQEFLGRLRSNAHDLIRFSGCPVISV